MTGKQPLTTFVIHKKSNKMESNFERAIRETIEKTVLQHGDYCEATNEQISDLIIIEGETPSIAASIYVSKRINRNVWWDSKYGLIISEIIHGEHKTKLPFAVFKDRLVNTVTNKSHDNARV